MLILLLTRDMNNFVGAEVIYNKMLLSIFNTAITYGAISGMASISDAGLHMTELKAQYLEYRNIAVNSLIVELILLAIAIFISIRKPFGKRDTKPFKHKKLVLIIIIPCMILGIVMMVMGEIRHTNLRNIPISDFDVRMLEDGEYLGETTFGNYTYHVKVTIESHRIIEIEDMKPRDSIYAKYASGVFNKIIKEQTPNVDAISGATTTSKAFMKAVENALKRAIKGTN